MVGEEANPSYQFKDPNSIPILKSNGTQIPLYFHRTNNNSSLNFRADKGKLFEWINDSYWHTNVC